MGGSGGGTKLLRSDGYLLPGLDVKAVQGDGFLWSPGQRNDSLQCNFPEKDTMQESSSRPRE